MVREHGRLVLPGIKLDEIDANGEIIDAGAAILERPGTIFRQNNSGWMIVCEGPDDAPWNTFVRDATPVEINRYKARST